MNIGYWEIHWMPIRWKSLSFIFKTGDVANWCFRLLILSRLFYFHSVFVFLFIYCLYLHLDFLGCAIYFAMLTKNKCSQYLIDSLSRRQNDDDHNDDSNSQFGNQTMHTHHVTYEKKNISLYQIMRKIWFYQNKIPSDVIPSQKEKKNLYTQHGSWHKKITKHTNFTQTCQKWSICNTWIVISLNTPFKNRI